MAGQNVGGAANVVVVALRRSVLSLCLLLAVVSLLPSGSDAFYTEGTIESFVQYPRWQACLNGSIGFEFKSDDPDGLLFYTDDGGRYDFFELRLEKGKMMLRYKLTENTMGKIVAKDYKDLDDNQWHNVSIHRKQSETILEIDGKSFPARVEGLDFQFGNLVKNNYVFLGGMPKYYQNPEHLQYLALPSIMFEERWRGQMKNLRYSNCSCPLRSAEIMEMKGASEDNLCETNNPCKQEDDPNCDCLIDKNGKAYRDQTDKACGPEYVVNYIIPFDEIQNGLVMNPTQLTAKVYGAGMLRKGVSRKAMDFDGQKDRVTIEAARKDKTCFGNLKYCRDSGFTMGFWLFPRGHHHRRVHILSSGGYGTSRPGISVYYEKGKLFTVVTTDDEKQYKASSPIYLNRLYHVAFSWNKKDGIKMYLNGNIADSAMSVQASGVTGEATDLYQLVVGASSQGEAYTGMKDAAFVMDEFNFWTAALSEKEIKDAIGPIVRMQLPFDHARGSKYFGTHLTAEVKGNPKPSQYQGRVKQAIKLEGGSNQHIRLLDSDDPCLVNLDECPHGMSLSFWAQFGEVEEGMYYLSSKNIQLFADADGHLVGQIIANLGEGDSQELRKWQVRSTKPIKQNKWPPPSPYEPKPYMSVRYFVELSWDPDTDEMHLYLNEVDHATTSSPAPAGSLSDVDGEFLIGKAIDAVADGGDAKYADMIIDELEVWTADRQTLLDYNFIQRGIVNHHVYYLDSLDEISSNGLDGQKTGAVKIGAGKIDDAVKLRGKGQFIEFGDGGVNNWVGNIDAAPHGQLVAFWIKPGVEMNRDSVIYENNGVKIYVDQNQEIRAKFRSWLKEWDVAVPGLTLDQWNFVEFDIDPEGIIHYHLNSHAEDTRGQKIAETRVYEKPDDYRFFVGRPVDDNAAYTALDADIDNLEIYEGRRNWLIAHGHILRGKPEQFTIGMDKQVTADDIGTYIEDVSPFFNVFTYNGIKLVDGFNNKAAQLDGNNQYIDLGDHTDVCFGDLKRCRQGFTMSHYFKINELRDNVQVLLSPGVNVFTKGKTLYVRVNSEGKTWELPVEGIEEGKWYNLLYTWRKDKGLSVFKKEGAGISVEEHKNPQATIKEGRDEFLTQTFQNALIGKTDETGVAGTNTAKIDHDVITYHAAYLPELDVWPGGVEEVPGTGGGTGGGGGGGETAEVKGAAVPVPGMEIFEAASLAEILGIISGVLLTLTSCALAAYYSGNAPCVTGYAAKKEGLGIGGPTQILIPPGSGKDEQQQLIDVSATNGAIISNSQTTQQGIGAGLLVSGAGGDANSQGLFGSGRTPLVTPAPSPDFSYSGRGGLGDGFSTITKSIETQTDDMNGLSNGAAIGVSSSHLLGGGGGGSSYGVDSSHFSSMTHHHPAHSSQLTVIVPGENVKQTSRSDYREENFQQESFNYQEANTAIAVTTSEEENYNFRSSGRYSIYNEGTEIAENSQIVSVIITPDDKYVIAGSRHWPPQVWDIDTGEIVHSMQSDTEGCSNLHLASGGRLLVGLVDILDAYESGGSTEGSAPEADRQLFQRLEVWNFRSGDPLTMSQAEMCSKVILTKDRNSAIFARCDRYGNELSVVVWDLIQMRAMREVKCRSSNLFCDNVDFLALSPNQDCAIVGYTNTKNGEATYVTFFLEKDINRTAEPKMVYMDANVECTTILNNNEAVTGTKSGELKLWNYRTGRTLRQLSGFTASKPNNDSFVAHQRAVTCMMLSENSRYLVSGSADATVKVWNMDSERLLTTLKGHEDEVWCSAISPDNEFIVTGSKDKTIRLWRLATGGLVCTFNTMVDIFQVFITSDKKTIVALGDREGSRILIMLKVVMQSTTVVRTRTESDAIDYD